MVASRRKPPRRGPGPGSRGACPGLRAGRQGVSGADADAGRPGGGALQPADLGRPAGRGRPRLALLAKEGMTEATIAPGAEPLGAIVAAGGGLARGAAAARRQARAQDRAPAGGRADGRCCARNISTPPAAPPTAPARAAREQRVRRPGRTIAVSVQDTGSRPRHATSHYGSAMHTVILSRARHQALPAAPCRARVRALRHYRLRSSRGQRKQ